MVNRGMRDEMTEKEGKDLPTCLRQRDQQGDMRNKKDGCTHTHSFTHTDTGVRSHIMWSNFTAASTQRDLITHITVETGAGERGGSQ